MTSLVSWPSSWAAHGVRGSLVYTINLSCVAHWEASLENKKLASLITVHGMQNHMPYMPCTSGGLTSSDVLPPRFGPTAVSYSPPDMRYVWYVRPLQTWTFNEKLRSNQGEFAM